MGTGPATAMADAIAAAAPDALYELAQDVAARMVTAARSQGRQARLAALSVTVERDSDGTPVILAGGSQVIRQRGREYVRGADVFFGNEFGSRHRQFPRKRSGGRWFVPVIVEAGDDIEALAVAVLDSAGDVWVSADA